jgi:hypothetical protein
MKLIIQPKKAGEQPIIVPDSIRKSRVYDLKRFKGGQYYVAVRLGENGRTYSHIYKIDGSRYLSKKLRTIRLPQNELLRYSEITFLNSRNEEITHEEHNQLALIAYGIRRIPPGQESGYLTACFRYSPAAWALAKRLQILNEPATTARVILNKNKIDEELLTRDF